MTIIREAARLGDQELIIETGRMAKQANGSVMVQYGNSQVLCLATGGGIREGLDFFPLSVDYVENYWAAGVIPGGYFKREGKMSEKAILTSRLIDRPCRPLFAKGYNNETQLIAWVLSADRVNDTDVLGITGCSAALLLSDLPWNGPIAGVRIGLVDGKFVANPTFEQRARSLMDIVIAVSEEAIVMVEGEAAEQSEQTMIEALAFGREAVKGVLELQRELARQVGKVKREVVAPVLPAEIVDAMGAFLGDKLTVAMQVPEKMARYAAIGALRTEAQATLAAQFPGKEKDVAKAFGKFEKATLRGLVAKEGVRLDGRKPHEIRQISCEVGLIPCAHGSALFTRGETQALATVTLGTEKSAQRLETLEGDENKSFMLHYNFPPFSVGEVKPMRGPGRREIGHGHLALRGLTAALPDQKKDFPYTIRIVSDVLESNGSSSMATVCGGSLAMMDAGVPVRYATAGIAMGLIKEGEQVVVLSDILGDEDFLGDMDFKVCGTAKGITAFQLDTKIGGIADETMKKALSQARSGITHILGEMAKAIVEPRKDLSANAPRITKIKIPTDAIGAVIGQGGKTIRSIQETTGTTISIEDDGTVSIAASNGVAAAQATEIIKGLTQEPEVGTVYMGTVKKIVEFGAFIEILPGKEGLCHISELTEGRVNRVEDILREGDECLVKLIGTERGGKLRLSRKEALAERAATDAG